MSCHNMHTAINSYLSTIASSSYLSTIASSSYLSTIASSKANKGMKGGWLPLGIIAQWQSTGSLSQRPWVRFPAVPLFLSGPCRFKGLLTVMAQIVSFIRHDHYRSMDHGSRSLVHLPASVAYSLYSRSRECHMTCSVRAGCD